MSFRKIIKGIKSETLGGTGRPSRLHGRGPVLAFTLVELLVVISIIALLIAMILPSLNSARDRARTVLDMGNQKHLFAAVIMYSNDFKQLVPGGPYDFVSSGPPYVFSTPDQGFSVAYRSNWYTGGSIFWTDKRHTQQMLGDYIDPRSPGWMCTGFDRNLVLNSADPVVGSPDTPGAGPVPCTMANIGYGYNYRPWIRKLQGWPGFQNYILRVDGPHNAAVADLFACLWFDNPVVAPHNGNMYWNISYLDGSIRTTGGLNIDGTYTMFVNTPPDAKWGDWTGP